MKPDFDNMSIAELRAYLLAHRNDDEAFYKLVDRFEVRSEDAMLYPCPDTPENIATMEAAIQEYIQLNEKRKE
ncbi:DUF6887 family protein [Gloeocapsopsis dulcis]|uniref:Uncharacterized protein n=1 Tax=Gloeocapsopsis dulcis AAB1 = 1H9 TaxID=1433147 RepID=A0A6N8G0G8_9CHRO|nr:hypothetical protein [Gloeocapsopsis dulcis]MUL38888.1 hypothetical protein [Gloeocapsopsis dulcis AAB1 = 1H9]WNN88033.1 hypothetical protein P0S91_17245 [Gloeocapsopsis dulcis]